jgi:hypothetical protein
MDGGRDSHRNASKSTIVRMMGRARQDDRNCRVPDCLVLRLGINSPDHQLDSVAEPKIGSRSGSALLADQLPQQGKILQVAVWSEVEIARHPLQFFLLNRLLVPLHEPLVGPPRDARGLYRRPLRPDRDLVRVQIVQADLVQKRLLHDLMVTR